ncbi:DUF1579 domain-containing protein [Chryseobacterium sp. PTM-20240506]|uniref:DUF1579 domain-containing protein n=1 Tax=unclassified Chryseobacterium TaxID=2593645 RepID=UPI00155599A7|nr:MULTISPECIES: DUF1579 domain-containing protein [unclassified Chryseobacterium]MDC8105987.1 DUF1579 domain-containing protein [Chryseobacterium sp. B21-037]MDQ1804490.1 DUF1579 domain-containing protein [Chryseobacterium sp. CKR4-1]WBV55197.1 DUF1579 domain-containing protein [Chryseobacterium daecheongense]
MKNLMFIVIAAFLLTACEKGKPNMGKESTGSDSAAWKPVDSATAVKAWTEYATPGEMHKMLAKSDGKWTGETTMWMEEGGKPIKSTSECTNKMIFGGRYQESVHTGNMWGMPFEGRSIVGYDNATKKFVSTWMDNMGTGIMYTTGDWNASKKSIEFKGKMPDIARPGKECDVREVFTFVDDNTQIMEMYGPGSKTGKEMKTMEIKFTRKK